MVSVPWAQEKRSQFKPSSWYMCSVPPVAVMNRGWLSYFTVGCGVKTSERSGGRSGVLRPPRWHGAQAGSQFPP